MKISELIKATLAGGFYVKDYQQTHNALKSEYMCHAIEFYAMVNDSYYGESNEIIVATQEAIMSKFGDFCETLTTHLKKNGCKKYKSHHGRWGHNSKACFNLRVKWYENLIEELEAQEL